MAISPLILTTLSSSLFDDDDDDFFSPWHAYAANGLSSFADSAIFQLAAAACNPIILYSPHETSFHFVCTS